ncbi:ribonuclease domain-containing protein [Pseudoxanthomonas indica]|uniref:Guanyl-specific ribonuclease Sa n=1 Tax=Pseudoxanthomonas indica TaxID=428993 RepID=A0A1T5IR45_9GAMM|nr:ribonuclease domain-containing protein [Pseudoxanthomonas indica]GGD53802.1 hypothetical protein GCM10007235_27590 [Pseudoxanthomonas indica]SKC41621.1 Guanyl-specific ribonuclease Sa [Pseudoxanthomonas indica]
MPRRSRRRGGGTAWGKPLLILVVLALLVGGGYWWFGRGDAPPEAQAPATISSDGRSEASLPLPPVESTAPGDVTAPATLPPPAAANPSAGNRSAAGAPAADALPTYLPPEARQTLELIARGGPYPHRQDGSVFGNREGRLPRQPKGYYHEYTVDTPNLGHRGARRIVTGGNPPAEFYYSDDHYDSFRRFEYDLPEAR